MIYNMTPFGELEFSLIGGGSQHMAEPLAGDPYILVGWSPAFYGS